MPLTIGTNIASLLVRRHLSGVQSGIAESLQRIVSGMRINSAADDPGGLSLATSLRTASVVNGRAIRNVNDGISMLSVADAALAELTSITTRITELAAQAASGSVTDFQRIALDDEADALVAEYRRVVASTSFNGIQVLDSTREATVLQAGAGSQAAIVLTTPATPDIGSTSTVTTPDGTFAAGVGYGTGNGLYQVALADFDGNGSLDIAHSSDTVGLYLNDGDGGFTQTFAVNFAGAIGITAGDFNEDGDMDFVTGAYGDVMFYAGDGLGSFAAPTTLGFSGYGMFMRTGDINDDGNLDVVFTEGGSTNFHFFYGNGNGTFQAVQSRVLTNVYGAQFDVADVDGDGVDDVVIRENSDILVYSGSSGGLSATATATLPTAGGIFGTSVGDVNGDGRNDVVAGNFGTVQTYLQDSGGNLVAAPFTDSQTFAGAAPNLVDINNDGSDDFTFIDSTTLYVRYSNGDGTYAAAISTPGIGFGSTYSADQNFADLDGDGVKDAVTVYGGGSFNVLIGNGDTTTTGAEIDLTTQSSAEDALAALAEISEDLSLARGQVGAQMSRVEQTVNFLGSMQIATDEARARIMDVDVAVEVAKLLRLQIVQQAATALLAQANRDPAKLLDLLV